MHVCVFRCFNSFLVAEYNVSYPRTIMGHVGAFDVHEPKLT